VDSGQLLSAGSTIVDQNYDVGGGGQTEFITTQSFTVSSQIDVWVNGRLQRELAGNDYTRNAALSKITFTYTVPENAWVRIRIYA
jgi:hypothetical protein